MAPSLTAKNVIKSGQMHMPIIGFGTWANMSEEAIDAALATGYRHIDTAFAYKNEAMIGKVLKKWISSGKVKREELFITTKLPTHAIAKERVEKFLKKSLEALQLDYVDLYLIHFPVGFQYVDDDTIFPKGPDGEHLLDYQTDLVSVWKAMEDQVLAGRAKAIGVSNFSIKQIERLRQNSRITPANNQVELHVYFQRPELREYCKKQGITICAYAPLGSPGMPTAVKQSVGADVQIPSLLADPVVNEIAKKHNKPSGNILLRYLIQLGLAVIPKSSTKSRIEENFNIFDFELDSSDMSKLKALDKGRNGRMFGPDLFPAAVKHQENPYNDD